MVPPLGPMVPPLNSGPRVIRSMPTKIMMKAKENNNPETGTRAREDVPIGADPS
jgi:hypothetical protein